MLAWILMVFMSGLFVLLGWLVFKYVPAMGRNAFIGIRIPWAMQSDANWQFANRTGGKALMVAGCAIPIVSVPVFPFVDPGTRPLVVTAVMVFGVAAAVLWTQNRCARQCR